MNSSIERLVSLRVCDVMNPMPIALSESQLVCDAAAVLNENEIGGAPVVDASGCCVGVLSARDIVRFTAVRRNYRVDAKIEQLFGLSGHADRPLEARNLKRTGRGSPERQEGLGWVHIRTGTISPRRTIPIYLESNAWQRRSPEPSKIHQIERRRERPTIPLT